MEKSEKNYVLGSTWRANDLFSVIQTINIFNSLVSDFASFAFIFIGDGDQKQTLMEKTNELNIPNVYFEDAVPSDLVADYLLHSDVCLTNLQDIESFKLVRPNKIFQYMALSKPIISGIDGEAREIIEKAQAGYYINFDGSLEAAEKLKNVLSDINKLSNLGQNGYKYVKEHGNRSKIFQKLFNIMDNLIKGE